MTATVFSFPVITCINKTLRVIMLMEQNGEQHKKCI